MSASITAKTSTFELRFDSLFDTSRALAFPCDALGRVDLDTLSLRSRSNYLFARAMVGRDFAMPHIDARSAAPWIRRLKFSSNVATDRCRR